MSDISQSRGKTDQTGAPQVDLTRKIITGRERASLESRSHLVSISEVPQDAEVPYHLKEAREMWGDNHQLTLLFEKIHTLYIPQPVWKDSKLEFSNKHDGEMAKQFCEQAEMIHELTKDIIELENTLRAKAPSILDNLTKKYNKLYQNCDDFLVKALNDNNSFKQALYHSCIISNEEAIKRIYRETIEEVDKKRKKFLEDKLRETEELAERIDLLYKEKKHNKSIDDFDPYIQIIEDANKDNSKVIHLERMKRDFSNKEEEVKNKENKLGKAEATLIETNAILNNHRENFRKYSLNSRIKLSLLKLPGNADLSEYIDYISRHTTNHKKAIETLDQLKEQLAQPGITKRQKRKALEEQQSQISNANHSIECIASYMVELGNLSKALKGDIEKDKKELTDRFREIGNILVEQVEAIKKSNISFQSILRRELEKFDQR